LQCVLVVNKNKAEGEGWRTRLEKKGYLVLPECLDLSSMVHILMKEKVHAVICSAALINDDSLLVLNASLHFFPRIRIIIAGNVSTAQVLTKLTQVTVTKSLDTAVERLSDPKSAPSATVTDMQLKEHNLRLLLDDHYLSDEAATALLSQAFTWVPGYVVIGVSADSSYASVHNALERAAAEMKLHFVLQYRLDEFYIVIDHSPLMEFTLQTADNIRKRLFAETDSMFSIGISRMRNKASELYACRKEAARASKATHMLGQNSVIHIHYLDSNSIEYIYPEHKEKRLIEATMDGDVTLAFKMLDEIFNVFKSYSGLKQSLINKMMLRVIVNLNIAAASRVSVFERIQIDTLSLKNLFAVKSIAEGYDFLKKGIEEFASEMGAITDVSRDALFYKLSGVENTPDRAFEPAKSFNTTPCFINDAIYRNSGGDLFSFFNG
jgi:hypothetical protein